MSGYTGWVLWRDDPYQDPSWRQGTLGAGDAGLKFSQGTEAETARWIIPGLVDVHSHLSIRNGDNQPQGAAEARENAREEVRHGVLAIREPGSPAARDPLNGYDGPAPVVIRAGRHIARPKRYMRGLAVELDDPRDLPAEVSRQAAHGDGWVKLVGDWIDRSKRDDSDLDPLWDRAILVDAVEAAHAAGARVCVHTFGRRTIDDLLVAGIDSIEHGSGMTREHAQEAVQLGIPVTPTIVQVERFPEFAASAGTKYPRYAETMMALYENRYTWFEDLVDAGVQLLPGSDAGGFQPHGEVSREVALWTDYGLSPSDALPFATWKTRDFLGLESLHPGARADFVVLTADPSLNAEALAAPETVVLNGHEAPSSAVE